VPRAFHACKRNVFSVITERVVGSPNRLAVPLGAAARAARFLGASWPVVRRAAGTSIQVVVVLGLTRLRMTGTRAPGALVATIGEVFAAVAETATEAAVRAV
jgi:hypothetical protein